MKKYVALLRGINVGGHKKVPMSELKKLFENLGCTKVKTIQASGNVVFEGRENNLDQVPHHLEQNFGFNIPVITIPFSIIEDIIKSDPFENIIVSQKIRLYVTFLNHHSKSGLKIPFSSVDGSFKIIKRTENILFSVLDLEKTGTVQAMKILEKEFGKKITTRNYNTLVRISKC